MYLMDELLQEVDNKFPCRALQARQLACFLTPHSPAVPALVVHGSHATGKSSLVKLVLGYLNIQHTIIQCRECITGRHLLERTVSSCVEAVRSVPGTDVDPSLYSRCENLSILTAHLQGLFRGHGKFVLCFDGVDHQREAPPTLMPALARLNEYIPDLTVLMIISSPKQGLLHRVGSPYITFPAYSRDELLSIVAREPLPIYESNGLASSTTGQANHNTEEDSQWLWSRFIAAVYDSQGKNAASDIVTFREVTSKLWSPFIAPIQQGTYGPRDFSKLMVARRALFQSEEMLSERIVLESNGTSMGPRSETRLPYNELPYYAKHLLVAAYLASHNPPRTDSTLFTHADDKKKRRKGGAATGARVSKHRRVPRRLLTPSAFPIERLLAIFHALLTYDIKSGMDVYTEIATLTELRLLVRSGAGGDPLDAATAKWRVHIGWEAVLGIGRSVGIEVADYVFE